MSSSRPLPSTQEIFNLQEAADFLGVSSKTFQKVLREGDVPGRKVGREWKFSRKALTEWVGSGRSREFLDAADGVAVPLPRSTPGRRPGRLRRRQGEFSAEED